MYVQMTAMDMQQKALLYKTEPPLPTLLIFSMYFTN